MKNDAPRRTLEQSREVGTQFHGRNGEDQGKFGESTKNGWGTLNIIRNGRMCSTQGVNKRRYQ